MSQRHDDGDPIEHDPTGMRALLGGLPDPGPMPDDLVARIEAAVAAQVPPWETSDEPASADTSTDGRGHLAPVVPLHRRTAVRVAGVAAAAVVAVGVGGVALQAFQSGGVSASLGMSDSGGADSAADEGSAEDLGTQEGDRRSEESAGDPSAGTGPDEGPQGVAPGTTVRLVAADEASRVRVVGSEGTVPSDGIASAVALLAVPPYDTFPEAGADDADDGDALADPARARACASALGVPASDALVVRLTAVGTTRDAALVVATAEDGTRTAWAVPATCGGEDADASDVIAGPVTVR
ncbi:hypothetical protein KC207_04735 [Phycicoccus sp. BSK3Z-2]|uniref:Uncharacterized protein n=1 Tax=Phycicoccus avicenniae TaxID=2828860 RepID=A0A941D6M4_9MICO|nr:hypothetical protein [Phycicoccus avicenniae]MBR7742591.1 hypothetical protein [Phycicoccus avicenniae]